MNRDTYAIDKKTGCATIIGPIAHDSIKTTWAERWIKAEYGNARKYKAAVVAFKNPWGSKYNLAMKVADAFNVEHAQEIMETFLKDDPRDMIAIGYK